MILKDKEIIMKVTVKEGIKGFSGKLSFGGTASAGTLAEGLFVPALAVAPNKNGGTASAGTKSGVLRLHKLLQTN